MNEVIEVIIMGVAASVIVALIYSIIATPLKRRTEALAAMIDEIEAESACSRVGIERALQRQIDELEMHLKQSECEHPKPLPYPEQCAHCGKIYEIRKKELELEKARAVIAKYESEKNGKIPTSGYFTTTTQENEKVSQVDSVMMSIESSICTLGNKIGELEGKLSKVLKPKYSLGTDEPPSGMPKEKEEECPLVGDLMAQVKAIRQINRKVGNLLQSIEL